MICTRFDKQSSQPVERIRRDNFNWLLRASQCSISRVHAGRIDESVTLQHNVLSISHTRRSILALQRLLITCLSRMRDCTVHCLSP